jgi:NhaP-type Na+/H+ or K+/H+ antiporter
VDVAALSLIFAAIFAWGIISARAAAISTPIFFVAVGLIMAEGLQLVHLEPDPHATKIVAEVTLVWVLFADASRVRFSALREDLGHCVRLLAVGLPLTTTLGTVAAVTILGVNPWYALLLGAALAPTDAALGSAVMSDRRVPRCLVHWVAGRCVLLVVEAGVPKSSPVQPSWRSPCSLIYAPC